MEIIRHIKVDLYGDTQHFAVAAKQMDMGTRYVGVTLMEDGVVYEIPDNVEVIINMTKPDRTHVHNDGERLGNEALVPLTRGMLMAHGTAVCEVQLYQNGALLTSANFEMEIFPSQRDDAGIMHSGEYTRLENTIHAAREALQIAQDTQNAIEAAEAIREAQERLRETAERKRRGNLRSGQGKSERTGERTTLQKQSQSVSMRWRQQSNRRRSVWQQRRRQTESSFHSLDLMRFCLQ